MQNIFLIVFYPNNHVLVSQIWVVTSLFGTHWLISRIRPFCFFSLLFISALISLLFLLNSLFLPCFSHFFPFLPTHFTPFVTTFNIIVFSTWIYLINKVMRIHFNIYVLVATILSSISNIVDPFVWRGSNNGAKGQTANKANCGDPIHLKPDIP